MSSMSEFLKWALPLTTSKTKEEALHWMKMGHPDESEEEVKEQVDWLWEERERLTKLHESP